jgi:phospholipid/cholesterol/gamma-HCH transport system ATP-binding protein
VRRTRIAHIELRNVSHSFDGVNYLFKDLSFELPLGKIIVFEGAPGCGKSILLRIMAGLVEPTRGEVFYNGLSLREISFEDFVPIRTSTAICFDTGGLLMNKTLRENAMLGLLYNKQWRAERSAAYLDRLVSDFELGPFMNLRPASVSTGVRKMAGLIRALVSNPQVLFLDEPSLGLGEKGLEALKASLWNYRKEGKSDEILVIASNDRKFIESFDCERVALKDGCLQWTRHKPKKGAA